MPWTVVNFGKYRGQGKTLPQIIFSDPDWFFWAIREGVFDTKGSALAGEAADLFEKSSHIRIPGSMSKSQVVEYVIHRPTGKFSHFDIVPADRPPHEGASPTFRTNLIDMSVPSRIAPYDKLGGRAFISCLKELVFGSKSARLTQDRCENFFDNPKNFEV